MTTGDLLILCAAGMLVSAFLMVGQKALVTTIRLYGVQSLLLGILAAAIAASESRHELFVTAAITVVLKAILIPWFLMRLIDRIGIHREIEPFLNVPASLLVCLGLTVVGYRVSTGFPEGAQGVSHHLIGVALSTLLIGLFLMVTRKKAITQILALLTVENAVFLVAVGVTPGMPLVVELGIAFDVIVAVLLLGILVRRIVDRFESMDVSRLSKLKG
jgi:hydrogenase-4 component E